MIVYVLLAAAFPPTLIALLYRASSQAERMRSERLAQHLEFYARFLTACIALFVCAAYGCIASVFLRVVGYGGLGQWTTARSFAFMMWWLAGVKFEVVEGEQYLKAPGSKGLKAPGEARVMIGNHQSELDVLMLGNIFPPYISVTAKASLKWMPFLGWFMYLSKTVFIERTNRTSALATFDHAARDMKETRQSVFIFPEGTRSYATAPMLLPFKKGAFHLAVQGQVDIVPVVCENYSHVLDVKARKFRQGTIRVKVLKPVSTKGLSANDVNDLCTTLRDRMLMELEALSKKKEGNGELKAHAVKASGADFTG